jgi:hypothetical protein
MQHGQSAELGSSAAQLTTLIRRRGPRWFCVRDVHAKRNTMLLQPRWALSSLPIVRQHGDWTSPKGHLLVAEPSVLPCTSGADDRENVSATLWPRNQ